jgi:glutamate synthase (NADPH/NADH) small chain
MHGREEKPIEIGRLQRFAMETFYDAGGKVPLRRREERKERVACIGGGPASLACAAELRQQGFQVTVIDRQPLPGGLNTYGVAEYKLRTVDSLREVEMVRGLGVEFATRDIDADGLEAIEAEFDAVFLGVGLGAMHKLAVEGGSEAGVVDALEFIARYKTAYIGETEKNLGHAVEALKVGRRVVVIGAGNTAIDAAVAAKRLGAEIVTIVYRRQREAISAFDFEYDHALLEGVEFVWGTLPVAVKVGEDSLTLECVRVETDAAGVLGAVAGSEFGIVCDVVIPAIGQSPLVEGVKFLLRSCLKNSACNTTAPSTGTIFRC